MAREKFSFQVNMNFGNLGASQKILALAFSKKQNRIIEVWGASLGIVLRRIKKDTPCKLEDIELTFQPEE